MNKYDRDPWHDAEVVPLWFLVMIILLLVLTFCFVGCAGKVGGIDLSLGSHEHGLWFDADEREYCPECAGVKVSLLWGHLIRPIPWGSNPWRGGEPLFVIRTPIICPYISLALGEYGFYLGCKDFEIAEKHLGDDRYGKWLKDDERGDYLTISATTRTTRWK